jgi:hypothetical protein
MTFFSRSLADCWPDLAETGRQLAIIGMGRHTPFSSSELVEEQSPHDA